MPVGENTVEMMARAKGSPLPLFNVRKRNALNSVAKISPTYAGPFNSAAAHNAGGLMLNEFCTQKPELKPNETSLRNSLPQNAQRNDQTPPFKYELIADWRAVSLGVRERCCIATEMTPSHQIN